MLITNVSNEETKSRIVVELESHFILFEFVAREDDNLLWVEVLEGVLDESFTE